jgi:hypothetical protein
VSQPNIIVDALLGDESDPKDMAQRVEIGSELFEDFMKNYREECLKLMKAAKASGALTGQEPEGIVIRIVMAIAAERFNVESIANGNYRKLARNLQKFL